MLQNILTGDCNGRFAMVSKISPDLFWEDYNDSYSLESLCFLAHLRVVPIYWLIDSGICGNISLGPRYLSALFCVIHCGLLTPAYPAKAKESRWFPWRGSVAPSLLRASIAGDMCLEAESWVATKTILLCREQRHQMQKGEISWKWE